MSNKLGIFIFTLFIALSSSAQDSWTSEFLNVGTFSSPRTVDLNNDGTKDIVMGAGRLEFQACDSAVIAIDGKSGSLLWNVSASDQMFGSAIFQDISGNGIPDIFIGGRSAEMIAIEGSSGDVLWRFQTANDSTKSWFNFYNPTFVDDQDGDGLRDLLVANGGDVMVAAHDPNRPPGSLLILSSKTGHIISEALMPDGRETYMSPVLLPGGQIIYGTGGETVGGHLLNAELEDLLEGSLEGSDTLAASKHKGYIGPPSIIDINKDGVLDIIVNAVAGKLTAISGKDFKPIWEVELPNTESYSSPALGYFNEDSIPDVFVSFGQGVWPDLDWSIQVMVNGKTGEIEFQDSLGYYQNSTPLAVDLNADGIDEVVMSLNFQEINDKYQKFFYTTLIAMEFKSGQTLKIANEYEGSNLSSTPWIGDLDNNGFLDLIYCHGSSLRHTYDFSGMKVHRIATQIPITEKIKWGSYQGSSYDGIYR